MVTIPRKSVGALTDLHSRFLLYYYNNLRTNLPLYLFWQTFVAKPDRLSWASGPCIWPSITASNQKEYRDRKISHRFLTRLFCTTKSSVKNYLINQYKKVIKARFKVTKKLDFESSQNKSPFWTFGSTECDLPRSLENHIITFVARLCKLTQFWVDRL